MLLSPFNNSFFYRNNNYLFLRFNYINPKEFKNFKKHLFDNNLNLKFFFKKDIKKLNLSNKELFFFKEFKNSKVYYLYSLNENVDIFNYHNNVNLLLNNYFKLTSYNILFFKFKFDFIRPFNNNIQIILNYNILSFNFYFLQLFFLLDFFILFFNVEE
jgi:hypothetical protein